MVAPPCEWLCKIGALLDEANNSWPAMDSVRHLGCLKEAFHTLATPFYTHTVHTKFGEDTLIGRGNMAPKLNSKQRPLVADFYLQFQLQHVSCYGTSLCMIIQNFSEMTYRPVTVPTVLFTRPTAPLLCEWANCQSGNTQDGRTTSDRESDDRC